MVDDSSTHVLVSFKDQVVLMELFPCRRSKHPVEGPLLFSVPQVVVVMSDGSERSFLSHLVDEFFASL
jgi:hypothetical protein